MTQLKPGDEIVVKIGGREYKTVIDSRGIQRFPVNTLFVHLLAQGKINLNQLVIDFQEEKFSQKDYLHFCTGLGGSLGAFADDPSFQDLEIENPLSSKKS